MPAPQSDGPVPGRWQVEVPFGTTFQPCALSSAAAVDGEYGYGPPECSSGDAHGGKAWMGTGPLPGSA